MEKGKRIHCNAFLPPSDNSVWLSNPLRPRVSPTHFLFFAEEIKTTKNLPFSSSGMKPHPSSHWLAGPRWSNICILSCSYQWHSGSLRDGSANGGVFRSFEIEFQIKHCFVIISQSACMQWHEARHRYDTAVTTCRHIPNMCALPVPILIGWTFLFYVLDTTSVWLIWRRPNSKARKHRFENRKYCRWKDVFESKFTLRSVEIERKLTFHLQNHIHPVTNAWHTNSAHPYLNKKKHTQIPVTQADDSVEVHSNSSWRRKQ